MSEKGNQAVKTVSFMMLITLFGKILGMVREQLLAANYGTDMQAAAFLLASRIPRTFFDVIFASAISASFIPVFVEYLQKKGRQEAFSLANRFITMISTVTLLMMLLGMAFAKPLTRKRIDCDLYYIENWTLGLDFKILFLTFFKGFVNKNAY